MIHAIAMSPRPRPPDAVLHCLVACHRSAWADVRDGADETGEDCDALVRALTLCHAKTPEGLRAKGSVIKARLLDGTVDALLNDVGLDAPDAKLIFSFAADALALAGE